MRSRIFTIAILSGLMTLFLAGLAYGNTGCHTMQECFAVRKSISLKIDELLTGLRSDSADKINDLVDFLQRYRNEVDHKIAEFDRDIEIGSEVIIPSTFSFHSIYT